MRLLTLFRLPFGIAVLAGLGAAVSGAWHLVVLAVLAGAGIFVLGRDPERNVPSHPLGIVSPVDGRVESVERAEDPFLRRDALAVVVQQGPIAPAILCSPAEGRIVQIWAGPDIPGHIDGERLAIHLRTDEGDDVVFSVSRPRLFRGPLRWSVQPGERVGQGQRRGLAGWGRRVTLYLPPESTPAVQSGASVDAGAALLCQLVHGG
jgi:phosphatidylserine decarboxylase